VEDLSNGVAPQKIRTGNRMQLTESETRDFNSFKYAVRRRALKLIALALIVVAALGRTDALYGLIFGACIGFVNMNLMFFNVSRMSVVPGKARSKTMISTFIRIAIILGAGIACVYKGFNIISMAVGFLLTYASIISIPITDRIKLRFLTSKTNADEN
jgi:hypothetical protein